MRIEKLIVKDFRSHGLTRVTFTSGINLIIGQNGNGKSSLLDALLIGLYWPSRPKDLKKDDILRAGGTSTEVTVFFEKDGVRYQIHRNITRGMAFAKYHDGTSWKHVTEASQRAVRDWMERLVPYDVFLNAIYIRQGEIDAILESDESREKVVRQVLGLDRYENAYRNLLEVRKEIERRISSAEDYLKSTENLDGLMEELERELEDTLREINELSPQIPELEKKLGGEVEKRLGGELDALAEEINALRLKIRQREGNVKALEARLGELKKGIEEIRKRIGELEKKVKEFRRLKEKAELYLKLVEFRKRYADEKARNEKLAEGYRTQIKAIEERLSELGEMEKRIRELEKKREELKGKIEGLEESVKAYEEVRSLKGNLERLKKRLELKPEEIERLGKEIEAAKRRKDEIQRELEEINGKRGGELKSRVGERNKAILELKKAKGRCPVCGSELTEEHKRELITKYQLEVKDVLREIRELDSREQKLRSELVKVEATLKRERELISQMELFEQIKELEGKLKKYDLEGGLRKAVEECDELKAALGEVEGELKSLKTEFGKAKALEKRKEELRKKLEAIERKLAELEGGELAELGFSSVGELDERVKELEPAYRRYLELKGGAESELESERKRLERTEKELAEAEKELQEESSSLKGGLRESLREKEKLYSKEEHEKIRESFVSLSRELAGKRTQLKELEKKRDGTMEKLKKLGEEKERRKERAKELEELRKARERFNR